MKTYTLILPCAAITFSACEKKRNKLSLDEIVQADEFGNIVDSVQISTILFSNI
jgi:hypothetical protein